MVAITPSTFSPEPRTWTSGAFSGHGPDGLAAFGEWRGSAVESATDFVSWESWELIENPAWQIAAWAPRPDVQLTLSYPLWPNTGGSLEEAASGADDAHWTKLAENLVAAGMGKTILRIGWEFNAPWYPWAVADATDAANFASAWRQIVDAMRAVPGQQFGFEWAPIASTGGIDPALAYPGDDYVTDIGLSAYDDRGAPGTTPAERWDSLVNDGYGLAWHASFAAEHGKPIAFPEWGLTYSLGSPESSGGDNPLFVQNMYSWFATHDTAYENYFNWDTQYGLLYGLTTGNGRFTDAAEAYRARY